MTNTLGWVPCGKCRHWRPQIYLYGKAHAGMCHRGDGYPWDGKESEAGWCCKFGQVERGEAAKETRGELL